MKYLFLLILNLIINVSINSQNDSITKVFYKDGSLASEGILHNGKPDGYWKTYYDNGNLKSEGNRKNYELDSLWIFYDKVGVINKTIYYKNGLKNGSEEFYKNGVWNFTVIGVAHLFFELYGIGVKVGIDISCSQLLKAVEGITMTFFVERNQ